MKKLFFVVCLSLSCLQLEAQTTRPAVLVIGNGNAATAAAIQAAVSGVKTTILLQAGGFDIHPLANEVNSGLQADFLKKINAKKGIKDSLANTIFDKQTANDVLKTWTDSVKNLTVIRNTLYSKAERSGNNWSFKLSDGQTIKPKVLIIAGDTKLQSMLEIKSLPANNEMPLNYTNTLHRTSVSSGKLSQNTTATVFAMYNFFIPEQENLIWLKADESMLIGQAAGATAAYAGFFDKKISEGNLKVIQGELINYKLALMPFIDIKQDDANWKAIQFVGVTGVIKAKIESGAAYFLPDQLVTIEEIKQPIKDHYYKAQLWFDDYKGTAFTLQNAINLVCYVGNKSPESTPKELEKKWQKNYKFSSKFDLAKPITRREFAVILQDYMPPFNVNVDKNGKVVR